MRFIDKLLKLDRIMINMLNSRLSNGRLQRWIQKYFYKKIICNYFSLSLFNSLGLLGMLAYIFKITAMSRNNYNAIYLVLI